MNQTELSLLALKIRNGLFLSASRTCGEKYIEPFIRHFYRLAEANDASYDAVDGNGNKYEIKTGKVLHYDKSNDQNENSIIENISIENNVSELNRLVKFNDYENEIFNPNIQNIKRDHFDYLIYVLLFEDCVKIFFSKSCDIVDIPSWCEKHGRYDQLGKSGQFPITKQNIRWHLENNLNASLTYEQLTDIYLKLSQGNV